MSHPRLLRGSLLVLAVTVSALLLPRPGHAQAAKGKGPGPKEEKVIVSSVGMRLVPIPAGKFLMGSPADDKDRPELESLVQKT